VRLGPCLGLPEIVRQCNGTDCPWGIFHHPVHLMFVEDEALLVSSQSEWAGPTVYSAHRDSVWSMF